MTNAIKRSKGAAALILLSAVLAAPLAPLAQEIVVGRSAGTDSSANSSNAASESASSRSNAGGADRSPAGSAERLGFSPERLERIAQLMQRQIEANLFPGAVTLIVRDDEIAYFHAQGLMDVATRRPMERDAVFRIMSMTKPVVAVSILMMVEEGKVRLTDPVSRFIPELEALTVVAPDEQDTAASASSTTARVSRTVPADREITIRDLLTHTAGFMTTDGPSSARGVAIGAGDSLADLMPRLAEVPLDFQPGTRWAYSGQFAFDVLARIVEIASGMPFGDFAQQRIFDPLGMTDTFFHLPAEGHPRLATLYRTADGELEPMAEMPFVNGAYFSGGGGLFSTAEDYLKFARMLANGGALGEARLLGRKTVDLMRSALVPDTLPGRTAGEGYGLGVRVVTDPAARN